MQDSATATTEAPKTEGGAPPPPPPAALATVPPPKREQLVVEAFDPNDPVSLYMNTGLYEQVQRIAMLMSKAKLVPAHLQGADKTSDCFLVVSQAFRWKMDPFAVAQHTFVLSGKLGYEGKLIAAVINSSGRLSQNLRYIYSGALGTIDRKVTVVATLRGESQPREIEGTVKDWKTGNQKWVEIPDQMLSYRGAREWARRHMPEAVLGVQADEEVIDVPYVASEAAPDPARVALTEAADKLKAKAVTGRGGAPAQASITDREPGAEG